MKTILDSDHIKNDSNLSQASGHLKVLVSQNFIFWLSFFRKIIPLTDILFNQLQKVDIDLTVIKRSLTSFEENVLKIRNNIDTDTGEPQQSSQSSPPKKRKIDKTEWKRQAKEVCDVIICQIKERFRFTSHLVGGSLFMSEKFPDYDSKFPEDLSLIHI